MKRSLSGIKPTGNLTLGNYIGALKNFKKFQDDYENFIFIADLHALTLPIDPVELRNNTKDIVAFYIAAGLDPEKTTIFLQSDVSAHSEINSILQNYLYMGELSRMTQFKDKSKKMNENAIGLGLFAYPVLMCGDILLYNADIVPVGEDQKQHVELCRDLVHRFNNRYNKEVFKMPEPIIPKVGARIMSLSDPTRKMSKSDPKGDIFLKDDLNVVRKKIMSAVTDLGSDIYYDPENKPGISNLIQIYASLKDISIEETENIFKDCHKYGEFKKAVADVVVDVLAPFQEKYKEVLASGKIDEILDEGAKRASYIANKTLNKVKKTVGLYVHK
ncbi:MAG: tryptophan--tRNA ligase [Candidatus Onthovivens sp.]|nr:tryptophan--tRNA ligase [Mollicutes bacterium]MCI7632758.1 tryptophan--tRNA ligase [Mollicutes bacterium]MDY5645451.1 tryptophan--tRNA ligase [Candidatus Onthovivens sp.]MDY5984939.1 tryptophan--tRNA ligase [Candidatus Onthovivens sp.]MDY6057628.1 tryptophan--tRNA ligase [Candidatus Onthovivens sp.]